MLEFFKVLLKIKLKKIICAVLNHNTEEEKQLKSLISFENFSNQSVKSIVYVHYFLLLWIKNQSQLLFSAINAWSLFFYVFRRSKVTNTRRLLSLTWAFSFFHPEKSQEETDAEGRHYYFPKANEAMQNRLTSIKSSILLLTPPVVIFLLPNLPFFLFSSFLPAKYLISRDVACTISGGA